MGKIFNILVAARNRNTVKINYTRKTDGKAGKREIRPYEMKMHGDHLALYATDVRKGATAIRSYIVDNIKSAKPTKRRFKPQWDVKL